MAQKTRKQMIMEALEWLGYEQINSRSSKYASYQMGGEGNKYFVGKKGALRVGLNASSSRSLTHKVDSILKRHKDSKEE